jgi:hypothetical protein
MELPIVPKEPVPILAGIDPTIGPREVDATPSIVPNPPDPPADAGTDTANDPRLSRLDEPWAMLLPIELSS